MPADRRRLRRALAKQRAEEEEAIADAVVGSTAKSGIVVQEVSNDVAALRSRIQELEAKLERLSSGSQEKQRPLVGFDFDCTLTVRHFYKVFAWGYLSGNSGAHAHYEEFAKWCLSRKLEPAAALPENFGRMAQVDRDPMMRALNEFTRQAGDENFRLLFREFFLGGEARIATITSWMDKMRKKGAEFAIITAGTSSAVLRALVCVPEWKSFFPSNRIWDTSQGRHSIPSLICHKALILRDVVPQASRIVLVDDSLEKDPPLPWVGAATDAKFFDGLPYEGEGVNAERLEQVEKMVFE